MTKIIKHLNNQDCKIRKYPNSDHCLWGVQHSPGAVAYLSLSANFSAQIANQQRLLPDTLVVEPVQVIKDTTKAAMGKFAEAVGFTTDPPKDDDGATTPSQLAAVDNWKSTERSSRNQMLYQASKSIDDKKQVNGPPIKKEDAKFRDSCPSRLAKQAIYEIFEQADSPTLAKIVQQSQARAHEKDKRALVEISIKTTNGSAQMATTGTAWQTEMPPTLEHLKMDIDRAYYDIHSDKDSGIQVERRMTMTSPPGTVGHDSLMALTNQIINDHNHGFIHEKYNNGMTPTALKMT